MENLTSKTYNKKSNRQNKALFQKRLAPSSAGLSSFNPLSVCETNLRMESINEQLCVLIERIG